MFLRFLIHFIFTTLAAIGTGPAKRTKTPAILGLFIMLQQNSRKYSHDGYQQVACFGILAYDRSNEQDQQNKSSQDEEGTHATSSLHILQKRRGTAGTGNAVGTGELRPDGTIVI